MPVTAAPWAGMPSLGGGLLIEDAAVTLNDVFVQNNRAQGYHGTTGAGRSIRRGARGYRWRWPDASGGGIYLASGSLRLFGDTISQNEARGGQGGQGGKGGGQGPKGAAGVTGGPGGTGGNGGSAAGGGVYAASGAVVLANDTFSSNQAVGGPGGQGGSGGSGGRGKPTQSPPVPGKPGGHGGAGGLGGSAEWRRDLPRRGKPQLDDIHIADEFRGRRCGWSGRLRRAGHGRDCRNHRDLRRQSARFLV